MLAEAADLSVPTVKRIERELGAKVSDEAREAVRQALEKAGVIFVEENGEGPGVRLRKRRRGRQAIPVEELTAENDE
jgi:hypothetical protein